MSVPEKLRRYNVNEIDRMRSALWSIRNSNERFPIEGCWIGSADYGKDWPARIEDELRSYMIGGVAPEELEQKASEAQEAQKAWYEEQCRKREERQLQKEYGPR